MGNPKLIPSEVRAIRGHKARCGILVLVMTTTARAVKPAMAIRPNVIVHGLYDVSAHFTMGSVKENVSMPTKAKT